VNTAFYIARRYLFAKKSTNAINIISAISVLGVFVGTAALVIILSAFNGLENTILKMVNTVNPQLLISPAKGKTFNPDIPALQHLKQHKDIFSYTEVLAENALIWYKDKQSPALIKGVSDGFLRNKSLDSITVEGHFVLANAAGPNAVIGAALQAYLQVNPSDPFETLLIYSPKRGIKVPSLNPMDDFTTLRIPVSGIFEMQQDLDNTAIVPLAFARDLFGVEKEVSSIEINLQANADPGALKKALEQQLGVSYIVKNRIEQNQALYNVLGSEKWMVYIILTFVVVIAIFNIIGSLTMLVIEKLKDISILHSLGAGKRLIRKVFLMEGMMITLSGCIFGLAVGLVFCLLQQKYGMIKMGEATVFNENAYPIGLKWTDFLLVFVTVTAFSLMASFLASNLSVKKIDKLNQEL